MLNIRKIFTEAAAQPSWEQERNSFFKAVQHDDAATVRATGAKYPDCVSWSNGQMPLEIAIRRGARQSFDALMALNADVNARCGSQEVYPLHAAIAAKRVDFAEKLLDAGARTEKRGWRVMGGNGEEFTALAVAIEKNDSAAVALLIDKGANPTAPCLLREYARKSFTPIAYARDQGRFALADLVASKIAAKKCREAAPAATQPEDETPADSGSQAITVRSPLRLNPAFPGHRGSHERAREGPRTVRAERRVPSAFCFSPDHGGAMTGVPSARGRASIPI